MNPYESPKTEPDPPEAELAYRHPVWQRLLALGVPFTATIGLSQEFIDDSHDPAATRVAVAAIIAGRSADEWRPLFAATDCCVTIMATLEEAMHDPHFVARGLFAHQVAGPTGATMPALPVPIDPRFRADPRDVKAVPKLSE